MSTTQAFDSRAVDSRADRRHDDRRGTDEPVPPTMKRQPGAQAGRMRYDDELVGPDPDITAMFDESAASD